mmetsp:Transcript_79947/g.222749  ORF Transcript_79947/g.222749 Transcript_79947/m.222749 type:complete len:566 (-) Transcript_79947:93-1790(-)
MRTTRERLSAWSSASESQAACEADAGASLRALLQRAQDHDRSAADAEGVLVSQLRALQDRRRSLRLTIDAAQEALTKYRSRGREGIAHQEVRGDRPANSAPPPPSEAFLASVRGADCDAPPCCGSAMPLSASRPPAGLSTRWTLTVDRPVGLVNRGSDCFWLAAIQCLRHTPGLAEAMSSAVPRCADTPANLIEAFALLLRDMQLAEGEGHLVATSPALSSFRHYAMQELPASDRKRKLVQVDAALQRQQDTHEFFSQLLDYLGNAHHDSAFASPRCPADRVRLEAVERELTAAAKVNSDNCQPDARDWARKTAYNLLYEYCMIQWAASATRMKSRVFGAIFEGQRLASISCRNCGRFGASGAEPFTMEEVKLAEAVEDQSWFGHLGSFFGGSTKSDRVSLVDLLKVSAESPAPEGYICPNPNCKQVDSCCRKARLFRLPATLVLHVNRAQSDGNRCETVLEFESTLDLNSLGMVIHFGQPLDQGLDACGTQYILYGAVFHKGQTARSGHYFAYIHFRNSWVRIDDGRVQHNLSASKATPMALEASEPADGARVALLFYHRRRRK